MRQHPRHSASASVPTGLTRALAAGAFGVALLAAGAAQAVVFPATPNLSPYAIVSVGAGASLTINSGPVTGKVLVGNGSSVSTSGGGNGSITGGAFADTSALLTAFNGLQFDPVETLVSSAVTTAAFNQAVALQNFLDGLGTTQTFGAINSATTITGGLGGLNVIQFSSLQNADLTISGSASDIFVLRTAGNINTNHVMTLSGGVTANHIIWDLGGTSGNIFQTSGGNQLYGTFLATKGGDFQFSALHLTGQLINTDGHIQFVSNSTMTAAPFTPPSVPEPATWAMMLIGFGGLGAVLRRRRAAIA